MKKSNKRILAFVVPLLIFVLLIVMLYGRLGKSTDIITSRTVGQPLPEFTLPLLSDTSRTMTKQDLPKQPFLLNIWGSWCPTCHVEHPFLMQLHDQGVPMIGVNYKDELADALNYLNKNHDPFIYSIQDLKGDYALDLGLMGAPESFVVGTDGMVYKHIVGEIHEQNWLDIQSCMTNLANPALSQAEKLASCQ